MALILATGLALAQLSPAWRAPDQLMVGNWVHPDCLSNHWLLMWVAEELGADGDLLHNSRYYWPVGDAPLLAGNGNEGFLFWPFHRLFAWPASVTWYALLVLTLNGLGGWALARSAGAGPWTALAAIGVTGAAPYAMQELSSGRFTQVDQAWLLFFLAAWIGLLRQPSTVRALLAALTLALTSFFYWYYGWFGVMAGAALLLVRRAWPWRALSVFAGAYLALIGPWAWVFFSHWAQIPGTGEVDQFPHPESYLDAVPAQLPFLVQQGRHVGQAMAASTWALGLAGLLLLMVQAARAPLPERRLARGLLLVWLLFWLLAMGPLFPGAPYTLIYGLAAPLRRFWWPLRHLVVSNAVWAAFAALALAALARGGRKHAVIAGALALLTAGTTLQQLQAQQAPVRAHLTTVQLPPRGYDRIADFPDGVLLELPLAPEAAGTQQQLIYQRWHKKRLLTGHALWVDRVRPPAWDAFIEANSFLSALQRFERGLSGGTLRFDPADLDTLNQAGLRYIIVNREHFSFELGGLVKAHYALLDTVFGEAVLFDRGLRMWQTDRWQGAGSFEAPAWTWPEGVHPGGPDQPQTGRRPRSNTFDRPPEGADPTPAQPR